MGERVNLPGWKKLLSYFSEIRLEETYSEYHPLLVVNLVNGRYQLCCEKAIYSYDDKYDNFRLAFEKLDFESHKWKTVLVLGLGLASVPFMLEKMFQQKMHYTIVEIDEVIVDLAHRYTLSDLDSPTELVIGDAYQYLVTSQSKFDIIVMDIFNEDVIPDKFQSKDFFMMLQDHLNPDGVLLYNRLATTSDDMDENRQFLSAFKSTYPKGDYMEVSQNWIVYNDSRFFK